MKINEIVLSDEVGDPKSIQNTAYIGVIDAEGHFRFINSRFSSSLHANVLNILYKTLFDFVHPGDLEACKHAIAQCMLTGKECQFEIRLKGSNYKWIKWEIRRLKSEGGSVEKLLLWGTDIAGGQLSDQGAGRGGMLDGHHYEAILDRLGVGILCQAKSGAVVAANKKTAEIFNTSLEQVHRHEEFVELWKTVEVNGHPSSFEKSPPMIALRSGQTQANVLLSIPDGKSDRRYVLITTEPVFENDPSVPTFAVSTISDITEEKRLRALCEQREALFSSFMNHSPSFAWIVDQREQVVYANKGLLDYFRTDETILNQPVDRVLPDSIAEAAHEKHQWVLENDQPHSSILKSSLADGQEHIFHVTTFPVNGGDAGKMVGGQAWDITESYRAKLQLKKTNERLLYLSRAVSEAVWDWNIETGQVFRNQPLLKMIGYHDEKPEGLSWWYKQIHPEDREKVEKKIAEILASRKKAWEQEYRFLCADGSYKIVLDRGFVVYQHNQPVRMVGSLQDISEVKQLEARLFREKLKKQKQIAEAILQAQEQERTRIGHELHDNVNQILFTSKLYLDLIKPVTEEEQDIKIKTQEFIVLAIEEIRKLSKELVMPRLKENGLIRCINELIEQLVFVNPFQTRWVPEDEALVESLDFNLKVTLFRIIQEQTKNIIKYSQANHVLLKLSVSQKPGTQKKVHLLIEDDGVGFDARQTRRGIGLSNIYERTGLYNGRVELRTEPGKGCTIRITIPFA
ncbi:MAG: PAS domain-containing protein [Bacteroidota bacterium]|nr:PAS domain-containing protein [Bacteroidota bacterium]